jgi:hypothetical protein
MTLPHGQPRERQFNFNTILLSIVMGCAIWTTRSMVDAQADIASIKTFQQGEKERTDELANNQRDDEHRLRELEMMPHGPMPMRRGAGIDN